MIQWLPRGYDEIENIRIRRLINHEKQWQLYENECNTYVLAVTNKLYEKWVVDGCIYRGLFSKIKIDDKELYLFTSKYGYMISSLEKGPFPSDSGQIEAFATAFNKAKNNGQVLNKAIYIEEYSLLLPTETEDIDAGVIFGKWLTGGVDISIDSFSNVRHIMSWIAGEELKRLAECAGFKIEDDAIYKSESGNCAREVSVQGYNIPERKFTLAGRRELETFINDNILDVLRCPEKYHQMGIDFPGATILYGPPGCGKSFAVEKLSEFLGWKRYDINAASIGSPYIHETSRKIAEIFDLAISETPSIIVIDEMEAYLADRDVRDKHKVEEMAEFLRKIPEAVSKKVLVFAMTNMIDGIDPAIMRRGRFDYVIEIKLPEKEEVEILLKESLKPLPVDNGIQIESLACELELRPLSDISFVIREAGRYAVLDGKQFIGQQHFEKAVKLLPSLKITTARKIGF